MKSVSAFCLLLLLFIAGAVPAGAAPTLVYSTSLPFHVLDLAVDSAGNAYALAESFVAKLSPDGTGVIYESSIWEGDSTEGIDLAVDALGRAYLHYHARNRDNVVFDTRHLPRRRGAVRLDSASIEIWKGGLL